MKDARTYMTQFEPAYERLEALLERVQRDAYDEGFRAAAVQLVEMAEERSSQIDMIVNEALAY